MRLGISRTSLMRAKLIRVVFPCWTGFTFTIRLFTPFHRWLRQGGTGLLAWGQRFFRRALVAPRSEPVDSTFLWVSLPKTSCQNQHFCTLKSADRVHLGILIQYYIISHPPGACQEKNKIFFNFFCLFLAPTRRRPKAAALTLCAGLGCAWSHNRCRAEPPKALTQAGKA